MATQVRVLAEQCERGLDLVQNAERGGCVESILDVREDSAEAAFSVGS